MKLIAGLGNPGEKYEQTRHNLGFMVVDSFARNKGFVWHIDQDLLSYLIKTSEYLLVKPTTFMNRSGDALKAASNFYKIANKDILIIHDDVDLEFGTIRLVFNSSSAGHKGVESVVKRLSSVDFNRLRVGIGRPSNRKAWNGESKDVEQYVLFKFSSKEKKDLLRIIKKCEQAIESYLDSGIEATMNRFN